MRSLPSPTPPSFSPVHNTWHSPMPYLFGGLAAMLGLIAFSLLILACSYWRLSGFLDDERDRSSSDHPDGDAKQADSDVKPPPCFGEGFVVIMAGDQKPTFLAMPMESKAAATADELQGGERDQEH